MLSPINLRLSMLVPAAFCGVRVHSSWLIARVLLPWRTRKRQAGPKIGLYTVSDVCLFDLGLWNQSLLRPGSSVYGGHWW
jgi:hypothetical protein